jgi:hypothetical protein
MRRRIIGSMAGVLLLAVMADATVVTNTLNQTISVGGSTSLSFSLTGAGGSDSFEFEIPFSGPYPNNWAVALTTGGDGSFYKSQIAMANGYHALLAGNVDVKAQSSWTGGMMMWGSSFFSDSGTDPNGWKNSTGYIGLVYQHVHDWTTVVKNYGWAEVSFVETPEVRSFTVIRTAYETEFNTAIVTPAAVPEPATALILGLGGAVIAFYRRFFGRV